MLCIVSHYSNSKAVAKVGWPLRAATFEKIIYLGVGRGGVGLRALVGKKKKEKRRVVAKLMNE